LPPVLKEIYVEHCWIFSFFVFFGGKRDGRMILLVTAAWINNEHCANGMALHGTHESSL
jgi:hypothetical protein